MTAYGQVAACSADPILLGIARDDVDETRRLMAAALENDVVLTSGGVSVGDYDFVKQVQEELGVERRFWGVATKPGKPLAFGVRGDTLVFGVPGNPVAAMVSLEMYVRPALLALQGRPDVYRPWLFARAAEPLRRTKDRTEARRCRLSHREGDLTFTTTGPQGSGILSSMSGAEALFFVPPGHPGGDAGEELLVMLLDGSSGRAAAVPRRVAGRLTVAARRASGALGCLERPGLLQDGPHDQPLLRAVGRRAGGEHQTVAAVAQHADVRRVHGGGLGDRVPELAVGRLHEDGVALAQLVELVEGRPVRGAVAGDGEGLAGPRQRRHGVVDRAAVQEGAVAVGVQGQPFAHTLLDEAVDAHARDAQPADGVACLEAALELRGQQLQQVLAGEAARPCVDAAGDGLGERRALLAIGGIEP